MTVEVRNWQKKSELIPLLEQVLNDMAEEDGGLRRAGILGSPGAVRNALDSMMNGDPCATEEAIEVFCESVQQMASVVYGLLVLRDPRSLDEIIRDLTAGMEEDG